MSGASREITVRAGAGSYPVRIEPGLFSRAGGWIADRAPASWYAVVTDTRVDRLYGGALEAGLSEHAPVDRVVVEEGEGSKSRETWGRITDRLLDAGRGRDGVVLALGGGVVGDLAGFVAATYLRGVPVVQVPTSLLAMVDSSVGGKTGVNTRHGKNLVGAFHPPAAVLVDPDMLSTLERRQLRAGLAECVKHACIADADHFDWIERESDRLLEREAGGMVELVERSIAIKAAVVEADEREAGRRKVLNFGHTLAHAEEHATGYARLHGEAVAAGMVAEARLGERLSVTEPGTAERIAALLDRLGLPTRLSGDPDALLAATAADKKARAGRVEYVLLEGIGRVARPDGGGWAFPVEDGAVREAIGV